MPLESMTGLFIKIIIMLALGFFLRKKRVITADLHKGLSDLLLQAFLPASILASANATLSADAHQNLLTTALVAAGYYVVALLITWALSRALPISEGRKRVFVTMSVFANTAFVGFPIIKELFGDEGYMYAVIFNLFYQLFFFTLGIHLLDRGRKEGFKLKGLYTNIVTIVSVISIALFLSPVRFPEAVTSTLSAVGGATVPISMIIVGSSLATISFPSIMKDGYAYVVSALRLLAFPMLMILVLKDMNLPLIVKTTCVVMTALPCGSMNVIYSERNGCEPEYAVRTVIQTMLLMIVTIPAVLLMMNVVL